MAAVRSREIENPMASRGETGAIFSRAQLNRRSAIGLALGAGLGFGLPTAANGQGKSLGDIAEKALGLVIDEANIPEKPLNLVRAVAQIFELEREADRLGLAPSSLLPGGTGSLPPLVPVEASFYGSAAPRLLVLIDRAEGKSPETAEKAGEILSQVNASQRTTPDALKPPQFRTSTARGYTALKGEYRALFESCTIRPEHKDAVSFFANVVTKGREHYDKIATDLQVPWYFVGAIHGLEASHNFRAHLHNGDYPLTQRTRQVPAGRPLVWLPPSDWQSSARDAIRLLGFAKQSDWSLERTLYRLEAYNGFGYRRQQVPTPYLWCYSGHYERGKFTSDGKWSPTARSRQCGAAVLIKALVESGAVKLDG